mmetsp:Transcript_12334/g.30366  ORF Transcript_12334/g.30366 Transcript_12334/m.30366 type:complete len:240 (-) Transcript_12334:1635-2354(-)
MFWPAMILPTISACSTVSASFGVVFGGKYKEIISATGRGNLAISSNNLSITVGSDWLQVHPLPTVFSVSFASVISRSARSSTYLRRALKCAFTPSEEFCQASCLNSHPRLIVSLFFPSESLRSHAFSSLLILASSFLCLILARTVGRRKQVGMAGFEVANKLIGSSMTRRAGHKRCELHDGSHPGRTDGRTNGELLPSPLSITSPPPPTPHPHRAHFLIPSPHPPQRVTAGHHPSQGNI